jgi:hypothetical protein
MKSKHSKKSSSGANFKSLFNNNSDRNKNTNMLLYLLLIIIIGFVIYYYITVENDNEGFENNLQDLELSTKAEVDKLSKNNKNVVFVFHKMDQCGHCKTFKPIWVKFSKQCKLINNNKPCDSNYNKLKTFVKNKKLTLHCKVADASDDLSDDVSGFPELRLYKPDKHVSFTEGDRNNEQELIKFITNNY